MDINYRHTEQEVCVIELARKQGLLRSLDLAKHGIPRRVLGSLLTKGQLVRLARGVYALPATKITENHSLALVSTRAPKAIICLLSALRFHELTTQLPWQVWIAIHPKARPPLIPEVLVKIVRFSGEALEAGVELHNIEGVSTRITNPARTVVDCFRYRNKIGQDIANEALRDALAQRKSSLPELALLARQCRIFSVMRPYLELFT